MNEVKKKHREIKLDFAGMDSETVTHTGEQTAYIALGSNIGVRERALYDALSFLHGHGQIHVASCSAIYETDPVGYEDQPAFLNMTACVRTTLQPDELLKAMLAIEKQMGRVRDVRWGPRIIDLDLLWMGETSWNTDLLTLPHPRMGERLFVLVPLADIVPESAVELHAFVHHALGTLDGKEGIRKWSPCKWPSESGLSASLGD
ncbi:2-amino-4-hydroxy-6-hydroxymethyldihydropteridine pyrophosphokinase FolK [Paenibacillus alvei DSM 29]|nr:2-amino-4-hydroxy-6-hydroxymethyldihydropteridine pyrophosphokinase FolK [Paenibacillus alvei DSM 29]